MLTRHEAYLFSLTGLSASTVKAQRGAITRFGLAGLSKADVEKKRLEHWRALRESTKGVPSFVLALQNSCGFWASIHPQCVREGRSASCDTLRHAAYNAVDWGRQRKRDYGRSTPHGASVRETDNGKTGWDRVVWRYADYGCVISPDGDKLAYSIRPGGWKVVTYWRGWFKFDGKVCRVCRESGGRYDLRLRDCKNMLVRAGWNAYLTRQDEKQIAQGSGERGRKGQLVLCVDFGELGVYHAQKSASVVSEVRRAFEQRQTNRYEAELESLIQKGNADGVYVCAADSYRAGNCRPGTESFASSHNLDVRKHYTAKELLALANGNFRFVKAAVIAAIRRERKEATFGYCSISEHKGD